MTPSTVLSWLTWISPPLQIAAAALIVRRLRWSRQPALLAFILAYAWTMASMLWGWIPREGAIFGQLLAGAALLHEMARLARVNLTPRAQSVIAGAAMIFAAFHAGLMPWTAAYQISLFRADMRMARALAAVAITFYRWRHPALEHHAESRRNRVYRMGVTAWLCIEAVQGSFIRGGLGNWLLGYTPERWVWVGIVTSAAALVTVLATAIGMAWSVMPRKQQSAAMIVMRRAA